MAWLAHSAKGTSWTKHKYIKKVGNRYYYKTDLMSKKDKYVNSKRLNEAVARIQNKMEYSKPGEEPYNPMDVFHDRYYRNNYSVHKSNIERKLAKGAWDKYAKTDHDMHEAVDAYNELKR